MEKEKKVPVTIISDGKVLFDNLHHAGLNESWLQKELKKKGIKQPKEILLCRMAIRTTTLLSKI